MFSQSGCLLSQGIEAAGLEVKSKYQEVLLLQKSAWPNARINQEVLKHFVAS